ncbi:MAG TPA: septum site-determining protein Ssd [Motilibacteraceae bacterium]|nr:septum site-determining protein Ssd [Motilibacteraceae bacterium]
MPAASPRPGPAPAADHRPLLLTGDPALREEVLRLAAVAGVDLDVLGHVAVPAPRWSGSPLVLVGPDLLAELARRSPARRPDVVVVTADLDDAAVWERAVAVGAAAVRVLPDDERVLVELLADAAEGVRPGPLVAVLGGRGGAGASTVAVGLAVSAAHAGLDCFLVDADPLGGGIDLVLGGEALPGLRWPELSRTRGRLGGETLREAVPAVGATGRLAVLSYDRGDPVVVQPATVASVVSAAARSSDLVVVDLPRHPDPGADTVLAAADLVLLVVPAEVRAVTAAARVAARVGMLAGDLRLLVRGPAPGGLDAATVSDVLGLPLAESYRSEVAVARALECGLPPAAGGRGSLATACRRLLGEVVPEATSRTGR